MESNKTEKYYNYYGRIVKRCKGNLFYYLNNNKEWVLSGNLMARFYDSDYDFIEIDNPGVSQILCKLKTAV